MEDHSPADPVTALAPTGQGAGGVTSRENAQHRARSATRPPSTRATGSR